MFDIETLERRNERNNDDLNINTIEEAVLKPVSIGCSNNITHEDKFFLRQSSNPDDAQELVNQFLDYAFDELMEEFHDSLPEEIDTAIHTIQEDINNLKFSKQKCEKNQLLQILKCYKILPMYGYNSCKYKLIIRIPS